MHHLSCGTIPTTTTIEGLQIHTGDGHRRRRRRLGVYSDRDHYSLLRMLADGGPELSSAEK